MELTKVVTIRGGAKIHFTSDEIVRDACEGDAESCPRCAEECAICGELLPEAELEDCERCGAMTCEHCHLADLCDDCAREDENDEGPQEDHIGERVGR